MLTKHIYLFFFCLLALAPVNLLQGMETAPHLLQLQENQLEDLIKTADRPVIIDFWAPWCPPCMKMKPIFENVASDLQGKYYFVSINIDENPIITQKYQIRSIPTFKIVDHQTVLRSFQGMMTKEVMITHIEDTMQKRMTQETLFSAIAAHDPQLVAECLKSKDLDVNHVYELEVFDSKVPMTPLIMASSQSICFNKDLEIIKMLLANGASIDKEIVSPSFEEGCIIKWDKTTARQMVEELINNANSKTVSKTSEDLVDHRALQMQDKAKQVRELYQQKSS